MSVPKRIHEMVIGARETKLPSNNTYSKTAYLFLCCCFFSWGGGGGGALVDISTRFKSTMGSLIQTLAEAYINYVT